MRIRDAVPSDLPSIIAIYNASIPGRQATADTEPITVESRKEWFGRFTPQRRPLWVVENEEEVVGWLSFSSFYEGRPAYDATAEISVYIATEHQGQGIGRRLLSEAVRRAPEFGVKSLLYQVFGHNEPSLRLCQAFGFTRWGHLPRIAELDGIERDLLILGLRVP